MRQNVQPLQIALDENKKVYMIFFIEISQKVAAI